MLKSRRIITDCARRIARAANNTVASLQQLSVEHEPEFTCEMLGRMQQTLDDYEYKGVRWKAKILTSHGAKTQERQFGADFLGVLEIELPGYRVKKGFMAQAKRTEADGSMSNAEWGRMVDQCKTMAKFTADAYVFFYSVHGIKIVRAQTILCMNQPRRVGELYTKNALRFYQDHFECFIGDTEISSATPDTLTRLQARYGLLLQATEA